MGKIREFFSELFSISNLSTGLIGLGFGMTFYIIGRLVDKHTLEDIAIFIGVGIGFILIIFFLGFLLNKTLFKDDE